MGKNIYIRRKQLRLTQVELAEKLGIGQQSLSRIERGQIAPKFERLMDIAENLQCTVAELFTFEEKTSNEDIYFFDEMLRDLNLHERKIIFSVVKSLANTLKENR